MSRSGEKQFQLKFWIYVLGDLKGSFDSLELFNAIES